MLAFLTLFFRSVVFREIIKPLARTWAHASVLRPIKDVCVVFKKDVRASVLSFHPPQTAHQKLTIGRS